MSTTLMPASQPTAVPPSAAADFAGELQSEWTKIRSVRSTIWALVALVVVTISFTALFNWLTVSQWAAVTDGQRQAVMLDPTGQILGSGFQFSQLAICVLGVLIVTGEYSSGTIRATLLAVPRRTPVLVAKALVFAALVFVVAEVAAFTSFMIGAAILSSRVEVSLGDSGVLQAILGVGLYAALLGVFAIAIGALPRHTAGAITAIIGFVLVLSPLALLLPGDWGRYVYAYLPTNAGQRITTTIQAPTDLLTAWQGFGVFAAWTIALILVAGYLLKRRDA
ncbi:MAG: ABC transporter permease [Actinobacteria bacterium]|nr:ABC transporter permease [Actinomycetota bacterium]